MPELNPEPNSLDSTTLDDTEYKTYIPGLKDVGGAISFSANLTDALQTAWDSCVTSFTGLTGGKKMWFAIIHPKLTKAVVFAGEPSPLGMPGAEVDSITEINLFVTPVSMPSWETKPTTASAGSNP